MFRDGEHGASVVRGPFTFGRLAIHVDGGLRLWRLLTHAALALVPGRAGLGVVLGRLHLLLLLLFLLGLAIFVALARDDLANGWRGGSVMRRAPPPPVLGLQRARSDLRDGASDLEAFGLVVPAGVLALLVPGQLQLLRVQLHDRLLVQFDVRNQRLRRNTERSR